MTRLGVGGLIACLLGACAAQDPPPPRRDPGPPQLGATAGTVGRAGPQALLTGPRARARPGDLVVRNERLVALLLARDGRLIDLGLRRGGRDILHYVATYVSDTRGGYPVYFHQRQIVPQPGAKRAGAKAWELRGRVLDGGLNLDVVSTIWAPRGADYLVLRTVVHNRGAERVVRVGIGDRAYLGNTRHFVPGVGQVSRSIDRHAYWVGLEGPGVALGVVTGEPDPMRLRLSVSEASSNATTTLLYGTADLRRGERLSATRYLFVRAGSLAGATALIQHRLGGPRVQFELQAPAMPLARATRRFVAVKRDGYPIFHGRLDGSSLRLHLPPGRYTARLGVSGAGFGAPLAFSAAAHGRSRSFTLKAPPLGVVAYAVRDERGAPIPARMIFRGATPPSGVTPASEPSFGDDGPASGALNVVYSDKGNGRRVLAPGRYRIMTTRGLEYDLHRGEVEVRAGQVTPYAAVLRRVAPTPGAISADFHLHAAPSPDSDLSLRGRLIQLASEGVEFAVATDHNAVTSYAAARRGLKLERWLQVATGTEVTTRHARTGHFNVFPLPDKTPRLPFFNLTPAELFAHVGKIRPRPVVQVNHPRMGQIGYFNQVDFDARLGRAFGPGFVTGFDAIEVFNGDWMYYPERVHGNLQEWFALLNLGLRPTATGNSDAHKLAYQEAGYPRNLVLVGHDDPARLTAGQVAAALRGHRVVVSGGPYIALRAGGKSVVGADLRGPVEVEVEVTAPCWIPVDRVRVIANGRVVESLSLLADAPAATPRPGANPPAKPKSACPGRLKRTLSWKPKRDTWYVVVASSRRPLVTLRKRATAVIAFTNPVWVDADGDGKFSAPGIASPPPTR